MRRPLSNEHPAFFTGYINLVKGENIIYELDEQDITVQKFISTMPVGKEMYSYAADKWTVKEVIGHIIDTERIMSMRALCFARGDKTELPGFDENAYVKGANFNARTMYDLAHEFSVVRNATLVLFKQFDSVTLDNKGKANGNEMTVRAILYMIAGHTIHHIRVIKERYLL